MIDSADASWTRGIIFFGTESTREISPKRLSFKDIQQNLRKEFWDVVRTNCIVSTGRGYRVSFSLEEGFQMSDNLQETIRESAKAPAKASGDAGSVEQHKLTEQIAADKYLSSKAAASKPKRGLRFNKLVPPGAD
jgi:hypothetical protein